MIYTIFGELVLAPIQLGRVINVLGAKNHAILVQGPIGLFPVARGKA